jgi:tRNA A-37 threonylcarbamoyl transferase component Bud32
MYCAAPEHSCESPPRAPAAAPGTATRFEQWWTLPGDWVEPPNQRRSGWSGVVRARIDGTEVYIKRQRNHLCRNWRHPLGWPTASREAHYLQRLAQLGIAAPRVLFHGARRSAGGVEAVLATAALDGYLALDAVADHGPAFRRAVAIALGHSLGRLHRAGLQHGCLYGKHVMIRGDATGQVQVALLDLEKMRTRFTRQQAARHDLAQLHRHQRFLPPDDWQTLLDTHARTLTP